MLCSNLFLPHPTLNLFSPNRLYELLILFWYRISPANNIVLIMISSLSLLLFPQLLNSVLYSFFCPSFMWNRITFLSFLFLSPYQCVLSINNPLNLLFFRLARNGFSKVIPVPCRVRLVFLIDIPFIIPLLLLPQCHRFLFQLFLLKPFECTLRSLRNS